MIVMGRSPFSTVRHLLISVLGAAVGPAVTGRQTTSPAATARRHQMMVPPIRRTVAAGCLVGPGREAEGMSGAPVIRDGDGAVAGVVPRRYNNADDWLKGTVW
jgi:hypothetical protein